jgi:hypothetical protein
MEKMILLLLLLPTLAFGSLDFGLGMNSTHSGRVVPSAAMALSGSSMALSVFSSGVKNSYYYHSTYGVSIFGTKKAGTLMGGDVIFGLGPGLMYAKRGFQDINDTEMLTKSDFAIGPAIRVHWSILKIFYLNIDAIYGVRDIYSHLTLNFQDVISFSVGFSLW